MRKISDIPAGTIHRAGENYLEALLVLQQTKGLVRSVDLAQFLEISKPSVCNGVSVLQQAGYLTMDADHYLHLTDQGAAIAERIYERHRFFTDMLTYVGVDPRIAEEDACKMEHCISDESFQCLKQMRSRLGF